MGILSKISAWRMKFFLWVDDVVVYDEPDSMTVGDTTEAVDTGARHGVFATAGGSTYLLLTRWTVAGLAALVGWVFVIRNAFRRRRSARTAPGLVQSSM